MEHNIEQILDRMKHMTTQQSLHPTLKPTIIEATIVMFNQCTDPMFTKTIRMSILRKAILNQEIKIIMVKVLNHSKDHKKDPNNFITKEKRKVLSRLTDRIRFKLTL